MNERGISIPTFFMALSMFAVSMVAFIGCGKKDESTSAAAENAEPKKFDPMALELSDPILVAGRETWMATCAGCHLTGLGGAPNIRCALCRCDYKATWIVDCIGGKEMKVVGVVCEFL